MTHSEDRTEGILIKRKLFMANCWLERGALKSSVNKNHTRTHVNIISAQLRRHREAISMSDAVFL